MKLENSTKNKKWMNEASLIRKLMKLFKKMRHVKEETEKEKQQQQANKLKGSKLHKLIKSLQQTASMDWIAHNMKGWNRDFIGLELALIPLQKLKMHMKK